MLPHYVAALATTALVLIDPTEAHSYMKVPEMTWSTGFYSNMYAGLIDAEKYLPVPEGLSYSTDQLLNVKAFYQSFNASKYKTIKEFADETMELQTLKPFGKATKTCGFALETGTPRELPEKVEWVEFIHNGPCEVWCDDKIAFTDTDCALHYPGDPASLPYDASVCAGAKILQSYWIALHGVPWQVYIGCVPLKGGGGGAASAKSPSSPSTTPSTTISSPSSSSSSDDSAQTPSTPATPPSTPSIPPATPSTPPSTPATPPSTPSTPPTTPSTPSTTPTTSSSSSSKASSETPSAGGTPPASDTQASEAAKPPVTDTPTETPTETPTTEAAPESDAASDGAKCVRRRK